MNERTTIVVESGQGAYPVEFVADVAAAIDAIASIERALVVIDANVAERYRSALAALDGVPLLPLAATEENKTLAGVERVCEFLGANAAAKTTTLVAVGGGIIQDVATFAAHIFYRGIPFVYVPTTLLSMSDSCIGAKCALNFGSAKNQLGFFQSPRRVMVCPAFLDTLADVDIRSGCGEIVKLALIGSRGDYEAVAAAMDAEGARAGTSVATIRRSLEIKRGVIERDEYEQNLRKTLNYGHTFGHALEAVTAHAVPHGIAVAWGCDLVNFIAMRRGLLGAATFDEIHAFLARHFAFRVETPYGADELIEKIKRDKKAAAGSVQLILLRAPGDVGIFPTAIDDSLRDAVSDYIAGYDLFAQPAPALAGGHREQ